MNLFKVTAIDAPASRDALFNVLERALPVQFTRVISDAAQRLLTLSVTAQTSDGRSLNHTIQILDSAPVTEVHGQISEVLFADHPLLDACLRGQCLRHRALTPIQPVRVEDGDIVLATFGGVPVWSARIIDDRVIEVLSIPAPEITTSHSALQYLHGDQFIRLLPLYHFIKRIVAAGGWKNPAPRACFMFDDPNMHWLSYGFVSYPDIIRRSRESNYHVTFATVPIDGWYTHAPTAALFRQHPDRISLLMHGNNHTYAELAQSRDMAGHVALAAEAVRRINRLEKRSGVRVSRAMAPPHGACSNPMMMAMLQVGVESAFISPWSLGLWDDSRTWPPEFGILPAEMVGDGFAVLPRFKLTPTCANHAIIAAFLGRPIVPVGHHHDLRDGLGLLDNVARAINRIPNVIWQAPGAIARSNFVSRIGKCGTLEITPYATRIDLKIPSEMTSIVVNTPALLRRGITECRWMAKNRSGEWEICTFPQPHTVFTGSTLSLKLVALGRTAPTAVKSPALPMMAPFRRILCEARDRVAPVISRVKRATHKRPKD